MGYATRMKVRRKGRLSEILVLISRLPRKGTASIGVVLERLSFRCNGRPLAEVYVGENVAGDPFFSISVTGLRSDDVVSASWGDSRGVTGNVRMIAY